MSVHCGCRFVVWMDAVALCLLLKISFAIWIKFKYVLAAFAL